jgi:putative endonuclease
LSVPRARLGARGEDAAARFYERAGYVVLARNWRCPTGELDLVLRAGNGEAVVFCEVKTRSGGAYGTGFEQRRLRHLAGRWLASARPTGARYGRVRFDVAAVSVSTDGALVVDVIEDAF